MPARLRPIGTIRSPFAEKDDAPIQGAFRPDAIGTVEVLPEFVDGLADIDGFSHLILLYEFDRAASVEMVRQTFLGDEPHGLFATRHPARPNAIGLTVVALLSRWRNADGRGCRRARQDAAPRHQALHSSVR